MVRQLTEEKSELQLCLKQLEADKQQLCTDTRHIQQELTHSLDMLSRYTLTFVLSLCDLMEFSQVFFDNDGINILDFNLEARTFDFFFSFSGGESALTRKCI